MGNESAAADGNGPTDTSGPSDAEKDRYIEIWKKAVETQMHFNEMSGKSRQLGLTFVAASLGVAVVMLARGDDFAIIIGTWKVHVGVLLIVAGLLALQGVRGLDLNVYHRMLRGAVTFGEDFERNYLSTIFDLEKGMTQAISHFSRFDDAKIISDTSRYSYSGSKKITAEHKIRSFYSFCTWFLSIAAVALFLTNNYSHFLSSTPTSAIGAALTPAPDAPMPLSSDGQPVSAMHGAETSATPVTAAGHSANEE